MCGPVCLCVGLAMRNPRVMGAQRYTILVALEPRAAESS